MLTTTELTPASPSYDAVVSRFVKFFNDEVEGSYPDDELRITNVEWGTTPQGRTVYYIDFEVHADEPALDWEMEEVEMTHKGGDEWTCSLGADLDRRYDNAHDSYTRWAEGGWAG